MAVDVRITAVTPVLFFHSTPFALKKTLLRASTRKIIHFRECNQDPRLDDMMPSGIRQTERKKKKRKKKKVETGNRMILIGRWFQLAVYR
jgi:hypothetical protein